MLPKIDGIILMETQVHYVTNNNGKILSVLVPFDLWKDISAEYETKFLLNNPVMKKRLLESRNRKEKLSKEEVYEKLGI
jgi:hypothetical protein